jgi:hypothetical protein
LERPRYLQGWAPDIDFLDCAKVIARQRTICVPFSCYDDVLVTDENSPLEPEGGHQRKFHAPGVGIIKVTPVDDPEGETLVLRRVVRLDASEMDRVRERALKLEERAYRVSAVYRQTEPAQQALLAIRSP